MERVKLPREVAEAVDWLHKDGFSNYAIIGLLYSPNTCREIVAIQTLNRNIGQDKMHPDDLIKALVIGYEIEQTPEEKIRRVFEKSVIEIGELGCQLDDYTTKILTKYILDCLNIKIEGVNA